AAVRRDLRRRDVGQRTGSHLGIRRRTVIDRNRFRQALRENIEFLAVGPTGLLYVTAQNRLLELDGRDAIAQIGNEIPITGSNCLRSQFTPDGSRLVLTCNVIGSTQIYVVDIITRTVSQTTIPNALTERFKVISNSSALYYIGVSNTVYRGSLATPLANPIQLVLSGS
ncbi:MAG: hypothetical protein ACK6DX_19735, partial [Acidobacteriota bacterium]